VGGDEFVVVLAQIRSPENASIVARRIITALAQPFDLAGAPMFLGASIGIAIFPDDGEDAETLLKNADLAMNHAKERGRGGFQFYTQAMNERAQRRIAIEHGLRTALDHGEFILHYQPRVHLETGRLESVEALVRWMHPEKGLIPPMEFIPVAEDTGMIVALGEWVLRTACAQARAWSQSDVGAVRVAVNISARQFREPDLVGMVRRVLEETGLPPALLEVEITEGVVMQDADAGAQILAAFRALGVQVALDDFGTGYSSLSYLTRFPFDVLKVDRSFVQEIPSSKSGATITAAIIGLARSLGLNAVAEGVETPEQLAFLREHGCPEGQGYLFAKPMPPEQITNWIRAHGQGTLIRRVAS
jgi:predicted signal transduction protein with EAL and GGDEF domain